jgi:hypothetical protein
MLQLLALALLVFFALVWRVNWDLKFWCWTIAPKWQKKFVFLVEAVATSPTANWIPAQLTNTSSAKTQIFVARRSRVTRPKNF